MARTLKWLTIAFAGLAVTVLALVLLLPRLISEQQLLTLVTEAIERETGASLRVAGPASFSVFPRLALDLSDVSVTQAQDSEPMLEARQLSVALRLLPLLSGRAEVDGLRLDGLSLTVALPAADQSIDGAAPDGAAPVGAAPAGAPPAVAAENVLAAPLALNVDEFAVTDSRLRLESDGELSAEVKIAALTLNGVNLDGEAFAVSGRLTLMPAGGPATDFAVDGKLGVLLPTQQLRIDALQVAAQQQGQQQLQLQLEGDVGLAEKVAELVAVLSVADATARGSIKYAAAKSPQLDADIQVDRLEPLLAMVLGAGLAAGGTVDAAGAVADQDQASDLPLALLQEQDMRLQLAIGSVAYEAMNLTDVAGTLRINDGIAQLSGFVAKGYDGTLAATAKLDASGSAAVLTSTGSIQQLDLIALQQALQVQGSLAGIAQLDWQLATAPAATAQGLLDTLRSTLELRITGGSLNGGGTIVYAAAGSPQVDAKLLFNRFDPAMLALAGPEAAAEADAASASDALPVAVIRAMDTQAALGIGELALGPHIIEQAGLRVRAKDGILRIHQLSGNLHGGTIDAKATLDVSGDVATVSSKGSFTGVDIARALLALEQQAVATGAASLDWSVRSKGNRTADWLAASNGPLTLSTTDVVLTAMGIEQRLCSAVALINRESLAAKFPTDTALSRLTADIQLRDGVANLRPLDARLRNATIGGTGSFDLSSQDFRLQLAARLSPGLRELDPACRVNARLTAIDWPLRCRGNLAGKPEQWCSVDSDAIVQSLLRNEAQRELEDQAGKLFKKLLGN